MNLAFIGLGRMGAPMARHLANAGHGLRAYDLRTEAAAALVDVLPNVIAVPSPADAVAGAEVIFLSLPGPAEVESVVAAIAGVLRAGNVVVDLSTNAPAVVRRLASELRQRGVALIDAPVSGGVDGAEAATLSVMAGGDPAAFERVRPLLERIGTKVFYCGGSGAGSVVKLCNNICSAANGIILGEALTLGVRAGVDLRTLSTVIAASTGSSVRLATRFPRYLFRGNFTPGFSAELSAKDTRLAVELAGQLGVPMAMGQIALEAINEAVARGWGSEDFDAVVRLQEERAGVQLRLPE